MNFLKDSPLSIINQSIKKRKNEADSISNKKVLKLKFLIYFCIISNIIRY